MTDSRKPLPELLVAKDHEESEQAATYLHTRGVEFKTTLVGEDYLVREEVPKLLTQTGMYVGMTTIQEIAEFELAAGR